MNAHARRRLEVEVACQLPNTGRCHYIELHVDEPKLFKG
jgi:hypothetical protein